MLQEVHHSTLRVFLFPVTDRRISRLDPQISSEVSSLLLTFSQWKARNKQNLWKKRWSTLLPGQLLARVVSFPSAVSSVRVLCEDRKSVV